MMWKAFEVMSVETTREKRTGISYMTLSDQQVSG